MSAVYSIILGLLIIFGGIKLDSYIRKKSKGMSDIGTVFMDLCALTVGVALILTAALILGAIPLKLLGLI